MKRNSVEASGPSGAEVTVQGIMFRRPSDSVCNRLAEYTEGGFNGKKTG
jgi:hypothetical protein